MESPCLLLPAKEEESGVWWGEWRDRMREKVAVDVVWHGDYGVEGEIE